VSGVPKNTSRKRVPFLPRCTRNLKNYKRRLAISFGYSNFDRLVEQFYNSQLDAFKPPEGCLILKTSWRWSGRRDWM